MMNEGHSSSSLSSLTSSPSQPFTPVTLITFDVDGTLVRGHPQSPHASLHGKAFLHAVGRIFGGESAFETRYASPVDLIPSSSYHGSTDGLISLSLAEKAFGVSPALAAHRLDEIFAIMYDFYARASDEEVKQSLLVLPGVRERLQGMREDTRVSERVLCALVTGNVEGIARKKMRACGLLATKAFAPMPTESEAETESETEKERQRWAGDKDAELLGGFGSDFCSLRDSPHNVPTETRSDDSHSATHNTHTQNTPTQERSHRDRGEQIAIAFRRAQKLLSPQQRIVRVVHVGDAPADILAAKWCYETQRLAREKERDGEDVVVAVIGVGTGVYPVSLLEDVAGENVPGQWEPCVLAEGLADPRFLECCKIFGNNV